MLPWKTSQINGHLEVVKCLIPVSPSRFRRGSPLIDGASKRSGRADAYGWSIDMSPLHIFPSKRKEALVQLTSLMTSASLSAFTAPVPRYMNSGAPVSMINGIGITALLLISSGRTITRRRRAFVVGAKTFNNDGVSPNLITKFYLSITRKFSWCAGGRSIFCRRNSEHGTYDVSGPVSSGRLLILIAIGNVLLSCRTCMFKCLSSAIMLTPPLTKEQDENVIMLTLSLSDVFLQ